MSVAILDQFKSWVPKLIKLRCDQLLENVDGGEAWDLIAFVHGNSTLNRHIRVFLGRAEVF